MPSPSFQQAHIDGELSNFSVAYMQDLSQFAGTSTFPTVVVDNQSDTYHVFPVETFLQARADERAEGAEAPTGGMDLSQDSYRCRSISYRLPITDELRGNADVSLDIERSTVEAVTLNMVIRQELKFAAAAFSNNVWFNGEASAQDASATATNWTGSGDIVGEVKAAKRGILGRTGIRPNRMVVGERAWDAIVSNEQIVELISGGATTGAPAIANRELVARALELESVTVAGGVAMDDATSSNQDNAIVDDHALLYYAPANAGRLVPTAATRFVWRGATGAADVAIKRYREEGRNSDFVQGDLYMDYKVNSGALGHLFWQVSR